MMRKELTKSDIVIGKVYTAKVSGRIVPVKIVSLSRYGGRGWDGINLLTNNFARIKTARRLIEEVGEQRALRWCEHYKRIRADIKRNVKNAMRKGGEQRCHLQSHYGA